MRVEPPGQLVNLLEKLGLATPARVRAMYGRVRRLARDLPLFESVWVDALAQTRVLTPFQAAEINGGRGAALAVGPFVLCKRLAGRGYAEEFVARSRESGQQMRLYRATCATQRDAERVERQLAELVARADELDATCLLPLTDCGRSERVVWCVCRYIEGPTAARWMAHNGRFPPLVALEMMRQLLPGIAVLEKVELAHGDVAAQNVTLAADGEIFLHAPGLRPVLREAEGYARADLPPEAFDYLAPERSAEGLAGDLCADWYSWGALCWHLLTGRPPLQGGTSLAKLRAARVSRIAPVERLAPETPPIFAETVNACLSKERDRRPASAARLANALGPATRAGRRALTDCLSKSGRPTMRLASVEAARSTGQRSAMAAAALAASILLVGLLTWPSWKQQLPLASIRGGAKQAETIVEQATTQNKQATANASPVAASTQAAEPAAIPAATTAGDELLLPVDRPLPLTRLSLRPGQTVRGTNGKRPLVSLPSDGIMIEVEGVRFVDVDFVWDHLASSSRLARPAMLQVAAHRAEFVGCSFQAPLGLKQPAAILWQQPQDTAENRLALPSSKLLLANCVFSGVGVGIDSDTHGALLIEATNVLHLGPGPFFRLTRCQRVDEPILMTLSHVTLREASALIAWQYDQVERQPGEVSIRAVECAFVPADGGGLVSCEGPESPDSLLRSLRWSGQGSVLDQTAPLTCWRREAGAEAAVDRFEVDMAGLVRSSVGFAGAATAGPAASRAIRWQVPLQSTDPPGIGEAALSLPTWWQ